MSTNIERVRYYDGEYLRSADFISEQNYHLEMRRRLNRALHLWGIVDGLELIETKPAKDIVEVHVSPGMAIDGYGRELFLAAPWELVPNDFAQGQFKGGGDFVVWAVYRRSPETPAAAGYRLCNAKDQLTRWHESIDIIISNTMPDPAGPTAGETPPDDPKTVWPIRLGMISAVPDAAGSVPVITKVSYPATRTYIGLRTQRITSPYAAFGADSSNLATPLPIRVDTDLHETKSIIAGPDDFPIQVPLVRPPPNPVAPETFPKASGNVKVAGDLFLKGDLYASVGAEWLRLKEFVQNQIPEIQVTHGTEVPTRIADLLSTPPTNTFTVPLQSKVLVRPASAGLFIALIGIEWESKDGLDKWLADLNAAGKAAPIHVGLTVGNVTKKPGSDTEFEASVSWSVGPVSTPGVPGTEMIYVKKLIIDYVAVFYP
jgi:hypothetical protein